MPATVRTIVTPEQFDVIYDALPDADRILTVSRKVVEVNRKFHSDGRRFLVKDYPKDKEYRGSSSGRRSSRSSERNAGS